MQDYSTIDLALAAWLRSEGIPLLRLERREHSVWMFFDNKDHQASKAAETFYHTPRGKWAYQLLAKYKALRIRVLDTRDGVAA
jgi:hypothetical protein